MEQKYCCKCGKPLSGDVKFCPYCGVNLKTYFVNPPIYPEEQYQTPKKKPQPVGAIIGGILLIILGLLMFISDVNHII